MPKTTIVVPIYGDWPSLAECIDSLIAHTSPSTGKVMLVNDCGPDVEAIEKGTLKKISGHEHFHYNRNKKNLGFVKTCNRAVMELDKSKNNVLLLNSDTKVTKGFLDELVGVLYSDKRIAVVSPRTNNATICTFPISAIASHGIDQEKSYELFSKYHKKLPRLSQVPTAHGFCMLIRRDLIQKFGLFDEAFGMGYGEEVDFCQRIKKHGWKCVISHHSYVFHLEARSFSSERKKKLVANSSQIIKRRYPDYSYEVRSYIESAKQVEARKFDTTNQNKNRLLNKLKQTVRRVVKNH